MDSKQQDEHINARGNDASFRPRLDLSDFFICI